MTREPIVVRWAGDEASLGYLGGHRWRLRHGDRVVDVATTGAAVDALLAAVFAGVAAGTEARARPHLAVVGPKDSTDIVAIDKFVNGWGFRARTAASDIGPLAELVRFLVQLLGSQVEHAWATGLAPVTPPPFEDPFSWAAYQRAADPAAWCAELLPVLTARMHAHPNPHRGLADGIAELTRLGHVLQYWSRWDWCSPDTTRPGLAITMQYDDDDQPQLTIEPTDPPDAAA